MAEYEKALCGDEADGHLAMESEDLYIVTDVWVYMQ